MLWTALLPLRHLRPRPCSFTQVSKATLKIGGTGSYFSLENRIDEPRHQHSDSTDKTRIFKPWLPDEEDELFRLREQGLDSRSIAERLQRSCNSVRNRLSRPRRPIEAGGTLEYRPWQGHEVERLKKVMGNVLKTEDFQDIATELDRPYSSVKSKLGRLRQAHGLASSGFKTSRKVWTQEEVDLVKRLRLEGVSWKDIGTALDRSGKTVCQHFRHEQKTGKPFNPSFHLSPSELQQIHRYHSEGISAYQMQWLMPHRSQTTIYGAIKKLKGPHVVAALSGGVRAK